MLKVTGIPLATDFPLEDMPHTISYALIYRSRIDSFGQLPKDKQPPRNLWDKPFRLSQFFEEMYKSSNNNESKSYIDVDQELE